MNAEIPKPIEFWFSFGSPYSYFAALQIDALAARHGRRVDWRPFVLGVAFKRSGMAPLVQQPMRGEYAMKDWERLGRLHRVPYAFPSRFPIDSLAPSRMYYALEQEDAQRAHELARLFFKSYFGEDIDISDAQTAAKLGATLDLDEAWLLAAAADRVWKDALRARTDEALAKGVFGAPFVIVDGEGFWGCDRLPMVEQWLQRGGW